MGLTTLQVCMDSSADWLQGNVHEEGGMDSSSSPSGVDILTCSRPLIERRLRPQHDQSLKCPRCDSTHTKFCYYNNYSLSQPRYFCKTCRRYWTKGGTLRNIPVGGGCRKNKKPSSSSSSSSPSNKKLPNLPLPHHHQMPFMPSTTTTTSPSDHLHLSSFPDMQFSHHHHQFGGNYHFAPGLMGIDSPAPIDFMESKYDDGGFMGNNSNNNNGDFGMMMAQTFPTAAGICPPFGMPIDGTHVGHTTLMLPYDHHHHEDQFNDIHHHDMKPNPKLLSLEWHDNQQGCSDAGKDSFGYLNGVGSWTGLMNSYGSSATNPLV